jgi:hypothetical protein
MSWNGEWLVDIEWWLYIAIGCRSDTAQIVGHCFARQLYTATEGCPKMDPGHKKALRLSDYIDHIQEQMQSLSWHPIHRTGASLDSATQS